MDPKYAGTIYWLLDSRFDFLLPLFSQEFGIDLQHIVFVHSHHWKERRRLHKIFVTKPEKDVVRLLEPDDINRIFSRNLDLGSETMLISFTGAGLPEGAHLTTLTAAGQVADRWNDKWEQFVFFQKMNLLTPITYQFHNFSEMQKQLPLLTGRHGRLVIKKPCLSGGYMMRVVSSKADLERYQQSIQNGSQNEVFLVSEYIPNQQSFASAAVVLKNGEVFDLDMVTEQVIYQETAYEGLIFPAFLDDRNVRKIREITMKVGKELGNSGYYGFFNIDFIFGNDGRMYIAEINARLGFGTILAACLYGNGFWKMMQGICVSDIRKPVGRLILGKIKGQEGRTYFGLHSVSQIWEWFDRGHGFFRTFFCGTDEPEKLAYGSFIGVFGEHLSLEDTREDVLKRFWKKCLEYYDGMENC